MYTMVRQVFQNERNGGEKSLWLKLVRTPLSGRNIQITINQSQGMIMFLVTNQGTY